MRVNANKFVWAIATGYLLSWAYLGYSNYNTKRNMEQLFRENPQYLQYTMTKHIQQILTLTKGKAKDSSEQELAAKTIVDCDEVYASLEKKLSALDAAKVKAGEEKAKLLEDALHEADSNSFLLFLASIGAGYVWAKKEEEKTKEDIGPA